MKRSIAIVSATILAIILLVVLFVYSGIYNVSQTAAHTPVIGWIINTTKERSVHSRADDVSVPPLSEPAMIQSGFIHYNSMCVVCHGKPGSDPTEFAQGLTPKPPNLFAHAAEEDAAEFFWVIKNGIRFTAMPAFAPTHSDEDIWNIVAFLKNQSGMSAAEYAEWQKTYGGSKATDSSANGHYSDGHSH